MRRLLVAVALIALAQTSRADKLVLFAGGDGKQDDREATKAKLVQPFGVDFAADGSIYIVEMAKGERLRAVDEREASSIPLPGSSARRGTPATAAAAL